MKIKSRWKNHLLFAFCGGSKLREARQEWKVFAKRKAQPPYGRRREIMRAVRVSGPYNR